VQALPHPALFSVPAAFVRGFTLGWGLRTLLSTVSALVKRRRGAWLTLLASPSALTLGTTIGSMAALFQALASATS
jgi:hypothetical protein